MILFQLMCFFCGYINHKDVPIITKDSQALGRCNECNKIIIEFYEDEP